MKGKKAGVIINSDIEDVHISPSQIGMVLRCDYQWFCRYVEGIKIPPSAALTLGSSYDDAISTNFEQKIKTQEDLPLSDVADAFETSFNIRKQETEWTRFDDKDALKDMGVNMVKEYHTTMSPHIMPAFVQRRYDIKFEGVDWTLVGVTDVETADGFIRDNKTTSKSPSKDKEGNYIVTNSDHKFQMVAYSVAKKQTDGANAGEKLALDYVVKNKTPKVVSIELPKPTADDYKFFVNLTATAYQRMEMLRNGNLSPIPNRSNMMCSKRMCGYWSMCENKFGGRVKE